ncbi:hypothetical protein SAMD00023353_0401310 [Rosellinia necatrix]|uniref:Flo11 n=1 Tax=Rosellinia necatrix TaxID=77044 RepID=A0A1S7UIQ6_ROSNE|nr:hypothetical protein SAMD00023353_0401310 [Rosellinia necatrix]
MPVDIPLPVDTAMANASSDVRSRAQSISSDRPSTIGIYGLMSPPLSVSPEAAFIAASAACQIVTNDHETQSGTWYDETGIEPTGETALVSNGALQLANNFVDQLLFNILGTAKSTTLASLRPAVIDVLKPKLAKDVINSADEELREYLGGGEIENLTRSAVPEVPGDWDLELVWKRTRLRCMVYSSLGDMEEEDEDYYIEQEHLSGETDDALTELVSPAVAIFLTSILEYMGEQVLVVAGQAAINRLRAKYEKELKEGTRLSGDVCDRVVVEEADMERVALDRTLGRLWRAWKKRIRSPLEPNFSRPFSRSSTNGSGASHQRRESAAAELATMPLSHDLNATTDGPPSQSGDGPDGIQELVRGSGDLVDPSTLPLPESDVEATYSDEEESGLEDDLPPRPKSWAAASHKLDLGSLFVSKPSVKRTPSLPSRKKPRCSLLSFEGGIADTENDDTTTDHDVVAQLPDSIEVRNTDEITSQTEAETSELTSKSTDTAFIGGAAPSGLTTMTTVVTTQVDIKEDEADDEIQEFAEEPEIMTSSRVSIEGRSSPSSSESGRPSSIILTRSNSIRSVRVIEVQAPRSRAGSMESNPRSPTPRSPTPRSLSISREGGLSRTPPIVEENDPYTIPHVTVTTSGTASASDDETREAIVTLAPPPRNHSPPKSSHSPVSSHTSVTTKVSIIANNTTAPQEERQDGFQRPLSGLRNPPMPTLPERSTSRPVYVQTTPTQRASPESPRFPQSVRSESPSTAKFKPTWTSEEGGTTRPADVARNFEELIQSNETLQYTLTPENMRNIDSQPPQLPQTQISRKSGESKMSERSRSSSIKRSISVNKSTGLGSHSSIDTAANGKYSSAISKALPPVSLRNRSGPIPQARDARVARESMQDFADFIRSTGPPGANITRPTGSSAGSSNTARSVTGPPSVTKRSSTEARRGPKLQARDAVVNTSSESSELIDFIRQGPPNANGNGHRIPRTVAPFRNTQDSDYMTSAVGGKAIDAIIPNVRTSLASTNITEASAPSSMNSQSALLNKQPRQQLYMGSSFDEDDGTPKRTRRRVQDPYAIDFSDENDDEFDVSPQPPPKREESLIDFLNNYPPPAEPLSQPIPPPKKKSSAPNLIARLRSGSSAGFNGSGHGRKGSNVSENRSLNSRTGSRITHTPIVIPAVADKYGASIKTPDLPRTASFGRFPKKFDPRDVSRPNPQTADLANSLHDPRRPPSLATFSSTSEDNKGSTGFSRMFERRKKPTAY